MKRETLQNMKRFLAMLLTVVLIGSSLHPAEKVFATESGGAEFGTELETETATNQKEEGESAAASEEMLEAGEKVEVTYPELYLELDPVQTSAMARSFWGLRNDGTVDLINGTAVNWIDRVDTSSEETAFIKTIYNALVEAADDDEDSDYLIEDKYFSNETGKIENKLEVATVDFVYPSSTEAPVTESQFKDALGNVLNEKMALYANYIVVGYDAFDRDHPEVFWLSGKTSFGATYKLKGGSEATGWNYSMTFYFYLQKLDNPNTTEDESFDIRAEQYNTQELIETGISRVNASVNAILSSEKVAGKTAYEKVKYFNDWLTKNNQYNTIVAAGGAGASEDCWECISALVGMDGSVTGRIGANGPVCEGYARAFKVLCDKAVIPCVLVDGTAVTSSGSSGPHMWNYAQVDGAWYGVDVTWNDPTGGATETAVSGKEYEAWLLVGANTEIGGKAFCSAESPEASSHPVENCLRDNGVAFINGPALSKNAYVACAGHTGGTATCTEKAKCSTCGAEYGDVNPNNHGAHTYSGSGNVITESCSLCNNTFGTATIAAPVALTYNGSAKEATVTGTDSLASEGWSVSYTKVTNGSTSTLADAPVDAGTYMATITKGEEIAFVSFTIAPATLTVASATATGKPYDGTTNVAVTTVALNGIVGSDNDKVTVDCTNLTGTVSSANAGDYSAVILPALTLTGTAAGNYTLTQPTVAVNLTANITISPKSVTPSITGVEASYVYTGNAIEPTVVLKDGETVIAASEYTVAYSNNIQKGTATITVTDKDGGNYTIAETTKTFIITDHVHSWTYSAAGATITATCNGAGLCPVNGKTATITLSADERMKYNGESKPVSVIQTPADTFANVEVSYKDANGTALTGAPVNAGTYTASVTMGDATAVLEYTIHAIDLYTLIDNGVSGREDLDYADVIFDKETYTYAKGSPIEPQITIT